MNKSRAYFIFRCKCCGNNFYVPVSKIQDGCKGRNKMGLTDKTRHMYKTHICDKTTSLLGIGEVVGMTDNGVDFKNYF